MKTFDFDKEQYRGTVKQLMKVRGIRKINLDNFFRLKNWDNLTGVHSIKIDLQDGYINLYAYSESGRCGKLIEDVSTETYKGVYDTVMCIFNDEKNIPTKDRRNILVHLGR